MSKKLDRFLLANETYEEKYQLELDEKMEKAYQMTSGGRRAMAGFGIKKPDFPIKQQEESWFSLICKLLIFALLTCVIISLVLKAYT